MGSDESAWCLPRCRLSSKKRPICRQGSNPACAFLGPDSRAVLFLYASAGFDGREFGEAHYIGRFAVSSDVRLPVRRTTTVSVPAYWALVTSTILIAAGVAGYYALRATSWAVMTDELQVARLAESIASRLSPVPQIHGTYYGALAQLYPLLLAPAFGLLSAPAAETAAHALNAVLLPSAAWPAYLLARNVTRSRAAGLAAAALTAFTPWLVLTSTLLTENAAYPAFVWAIYLAHRTLSAPSRGNDALALAGLALAFFARTQLVVLAAVLPLALVLHAGPRAALKRHPLLAAAYGAGLVVAGLLVSMGSLGAVVGNYAVPFSVDLVPSGLGASTAEHLIRVVVGAGVLPFVLATAWVLVTLARRRVDAANAFAVLFALCVPLLSIEVASFDLRFTPRGFDQDRYLFYLVPLFAAGAAAALTSRESFRLLLPTAVGVTAVVAWLVLQFGDYDDETVVFWAAPAAAVHSVFPSDAVMLAAALVPVGVALALMWRAPRAALAGVAVLVSAVGVAEALYVFERYEDPAMTRPPALRLARDWIDRSVPPSASVALVPSPRDTDVYWWEAELWNKRVDHVLRVNGGPTFSPFPADDVRVDFRHGVLAGAQPSDFLVLSGSEKRFHLVAARRVGGTRVLQLVRAGRPYRLEWATRGFTPDGWTVAGHPATLRFYGRPVPGLRRVVIVLAASSRAALPLDFTLRGGGRERAGWVDPGGARPPVRMTFCIPPHGFVDVTLTTRAAVRIPDGRLVGLHLDRVSTDLRSGFTPCG
jgi:Dolichyl-phosphate-mannose-protein mannosyltransferase